MGSNPVVSTEVPESKGEVVRFGVFEVDARAGELRRNGLKVKLQDQPFQILALLLERPGEVVSREEVRRRLWPADTFVDFDHSLNAAIKRLRDALRDSADNPRFIETLARRGYRFIAPVSGGARIETTVIVQPAPPARNLWRLVAVGTLALLAGTGFAWWYSARSIAELVLPRETRLTANSPDVPVFRGSLSPDGRLLAYTDPRGLFLREIAREDSHQLWLPAGFRAHSVSWFPDGNHLLVGGTTDDGGESSVWNVSILGGAPRKISDDTESGAVSPDGSKIAYLRGGTKFNNSELWEMNADGSQARRLYEIQGFSGSVAWSPKGKRLAYLKSAYWPGQSEQTEVESYELATGKTNTVISDPRLGGGLAWGPDGRLFLTRVEEPENGESNVWTICVDEKSGAATSKPHRLTNGPDWKPRPEISLDGKRLAFLRHNIGPTIYMADVDPKTKSLEQLQRLTLDESVSRPYEWTPDGKALLYISNRDGEFHIFRQKIGATSPELLVDGHDSPNIMRLNPAGDEILYLSETVRAPERTPTPRTAEFQRENVRLMRAPISGGAGKLLLATDGINNFQCARAPSQFCVLSKFAKDSLVFVQFNAATGEMKDFFRTSDEGWMNYNWTLSPDGKTLALAKETRVSRDAQVRLVPVDGGAERSIRINEWVEISAIDWAADGKSFWASAMLRGETRALVNIDMQGNVKPILQQGKPYIGWAIPSRDGKRLAIWQATGGSNVWMLEGF
ncbi:MAG TPA: winged helix-turn-helix domain-containing protein [Dongiaceae bacterium]|nr:winged helix-turn-helix domain-containing protein [Dongiaceae bacterium]